jgi:hypothetical protein
MVIVVMMMVIRSEQTQRHQVLFVGIKYFTAVSLST